MLLKKFCKALLIALLLPALPAVFVSVAPAQDAAPNFPSTRFKQYQGRYAVSFPIADGSRIHTVANEMSADADVDGTGFIVICADVNPTSDVEKFFDEVEAEARNANRARTVRRVKIALGSVPGREVELENETGWQRISRHYQRGNRYYQVVVQARARHLNREMAKEFLDSFALLDGDAPAPTVAPSPAPAAAAVPATSATPDPLPDIAPPPPVAAPTQGQTPLTVREEIVRMMHGTRYEDLAPIPPTAPAPSLQPTNAPAAIRQYVNRAGRYHVDFPKAPTESSGTDPSGSVLYQAMLEDQGVYYGVTYRDLQKSEIDWARTQPEGLAAFHAIWKDGVVRQQGGTVVSEKHVDVAGHAGYQVEFVFQKRGRLVGRIVLVGTRCYRFAVWGAAITGDDPLVRQFLDSFGIVE